MPIAPSQFGLSTPTHKAAQQTQFGGVGISYLRWLQDNPILGDTIFKDVLGFNAPKILLTRSSKERWDTAVSEFANTFITLAGSFTLPFIARFLTAKVSGIPFGSLWKPLSKPGTLMHPGANLLKLSPKLKLGLLAESLGFMFPFAGLFWANPFVRNVLTLKKYKTANFESLIGFHNVKSKRRQRAYKEELAYQKSRIFLTTAISFGLGLLSIAVLGGLARKIPPSLMNTLKNEGSKLSSIIKGLALTGKLRSQIDGRLPIFIFWLAPAYLGWVHASRGANEAKEMLLKFANSTIWFSILTPFVLDPIFKYRYSKVLQKLGLPKLAENAELPKISDVLRSTLNSSMKKSLVRYQAGQYLLGLLITVLMLSTTPQLLNWYLTSKRIEKQKAQELELYPTIGKDPVEPKLDDDQPALASNTPPPNSPKSWNPYQANIGINPWLSQNNPHYALANPLSFNTSSYSPYFRAQ